MPIYEFKCMSCNQYTEWILKNPDEDVKLKCDHCGSQELERIISIANRGVPTGRVASDEKSKSISKMRTCSSGSCTTYNIPGSKV